VHAHTQLRRQHRTKQKHLVGEGDMQVIGRAGITPAPARARSAITRGWSVVDRIDIADMASERAHAWIGRMAAPLPGSTARWSIVDARDARRRPRHRRRAHDPRCR